MRKSTSLAVLAAALLIVPAAARAQETQPAPGAPAQAATRSEADPLRQRIGQLQRQAMQDPSLKAAEDSFEAVLQGAMARLDPQAPVKSARALAEADVQAARQAYLARVLARMKEIDPETQRYVDRLAELSRGASSGGSR